MVYLYITLFALLFYPAIYVNLLPLEEGHWGGVFVGLSLFMLGTASATAFYVTSQKAQKINAWRTLLQVPMLMSIGIGIALNNAIAVVEALVGHDSPFIRTPKYNISEAAGPQGEPLAASRWPLAPGDCSQANGQRLTANGSAPKRKLALVPIPSLKIWITALEIAFGLWMLACARFALQAETGSTLVSLPFLVLFASGYLYVGLSSLIVHARAHHQSRHPRPAAA